MENVAELCVYSLTRWIIKGLSYVDAETTYGDFVVASKTYQFLRTISQQSSIQEEVDTKRNVILGHEKRA
ncbi:hypothetical protein F8M41_018939 [Gigaspora margarita]|uniref:Uncharacterized protein n=1 Tax=Gigaspora margarita TaxID=4874 RepID=A0A8H4AKY6_GIGMA|nr:hypothetical protein F8M41_018939 [Gigaspora margarita]